MNVHMKFEPRDLWIGVYWKRAWEGPDDVLTLYICVVPMLPIIVSLCVGKVTP